MVCMSQCTLRLLRVTESKGWEGQQQDIKSRRDDITNTDDARQASMDSPTRKHAPFSILEK